MLEVERSTTARSWCAYGRRHGQSEVRTSQMHCQRYLRLRLCVGNGHVRYARRLESLSDVELCRGQQQRRGCILARSEGVRTSTPNAFRGAETRAFALILREREGDEVVAWRLPMETERWRCLIDGTRVGRRRAGLCGRSGERMLAKGASHSLWTAPGLLGSYHHLSFFSPSPPSPSFLWIAAGERVRRLPSVSETVEVALAGLHLAFSALAASRSSAKVFRLDKAWCVTSRSCGCCCWRLLTMRKY